MKLDRTIKIGLTIIENSKSKYIDMFKDLKMEMDRNWM